MSHDRVEVPELPLMQLHFMPVLFHEAVEVPSRMEFEFAEPLLVLLTVLLELFHHPPVRTQRGTVRSERTDRDNGDRIEAHSDGQTIERRAEERLVLVL